MLSLDNPNKALDIYYQGEGEGSKCRKIKKKICRPPNSSENFSQTLRKASNNFHRPPFNFIIFMHHRLDGTGLIL